MPFFQYTCRPSLALAENQTYKFNGICFNSPLVNLHQLVSFCTWYRSHTCEKESQTLSSYEDKNVTGYTSLSDTHSHVLFNILYFHHWTFLLSDSLNTGSLGSCSMPFVAKKTRNKTAMSHQTYRSCNSTKYQLYTSCEPSFENSSLEGFFVFVLGKSSFS